MRRGLGVLALLASVCVGAPLDAAAAPPVSVRPGTAFTANGARCTFAFLIQGSDHRLYAATAGHCLPVAAMTTWAPDRGPQILSSDAVVGHARYSVFSSLERDFALVQLNKRQRHDPSVCHWGGPSTVQTQPSSTPVAARYYGQGELPRLVAPARVGAFLALPDQRYVRLTGVVDDGDSGGPVLDDQGRAVGVLTSINPDSDGLTGVNRLAPHLRDAEKALHIHLRLLPGLNAADC